MSVDTEQPKFSEVNFGINSSPASKDLRFIDEVVRITGLPLQDSPIVVDDTITALDFTLDARNLSKIVESKIDRFGFKFWHVEELVNQANELLERCIRERAS